VPGGGSLCFVVIVQKGNLCCRSGLFALKACVVSCDVRRQKGSAHNYCTRHYLKYCKLQPAHATHVHTCTHKNTYAYTPTCTHMHIQTKTQTHTHAHTKRRLRGCRLDGPREGGSSLGRHSHLQHHRPHHRSTAQHSSSPGPPSPPPSTGQLTHYCALHHSWKGWRRGGRGCNDGRDPGKFDRACCH